MRLRGLKCFIIIRIMSEQHIVEAFAASWIEIVRYNVAYWHVDVEAFAASWIEIVADTWTQEEAVSRSLCGFVD